MDYQDQSQNSSNGPQVLPATLWHAPMTPEEEEEDIHFLKNLKREQKEQKGSFKNGSSTKWKAVVGDRGMQVSNSIASWELQMLRVKIYSRHFMTQKIVSDTTFWK